MNHHCSWIIVLIVSLVLTGCSSAGKLNNDESVDYKSAQQLPPLVLPGKGSDDRSNSDSNRDTDANNRSEKKQP